MPCPAVRFAAYIPFCTGRDVLYADYCGNDHELKRLFAAVTAFRSSIVDGKMRIYVDGYCTSGSSVRDNLRLGYVRSSRVKSELITRKGMKEAWFVTHNHAVPCPDEERDVVVVCLREPLAADTLSRSRYAGYASRYPLLPARAPSLPEGGTCPVPALHEQSRPLAAEHAYPAQVGPSRVIFSENQSVRLGGSDAGGPFGGFPSQPGCRTVLCPSLVSGGLGGIFRLERGEGAPFLGCFGH